MRIYLQSSNQHCVFNQISVIAIIGNVYSKSSINNFNVSRFVTSDVSIKNRTFIFIHFKRCAENIIVKILTFE